MPAASSPAPPVAIVSAALPVAAAIGVFGVVYGAAASLVMGPALTVLSSVLVFSGAAQFTFVGLLAAGTAPAGVLGRSPQWPCGTSPWARCCNAG